MLAPTYEEYIDKLNEIPEQAVAILNQIRKLDKQVLSCHIKIQQKRQDALSRMVQYEAKLSSKQRSELNDLIREITDIHNKMLGLSRQKMKLSQVLYNCIDTPTQELNRDFASKIKTEEPLQEVKNSKYKRPHKHNQQQYFASEPIYCYCRRPSFGLMFKCESNNCQNQWFHEDCLEQKNIPQKWYCKDCRKNRSKKGTRI